MEKEVVSIINLGEQGRLDIAAFADVFFIPYSDACKLFNDDYTLNAAGALFVVFAGVKFAQSVCAYWVEHPNEFKDYFFNLYI